MDYVAVKRQTARHLLLGRTPLGMQPVGIGIFAGKKNVLPARRRVDRELDAERVVAPGKRGEGIGNRPGWIRDGRRRVGLGEVVENGFRRKSVNCWWRGVHHTSKGFGRHLASRRIVFGSSRRMVYRYMQIFGVAANVDGGSL